MLNNNEICETLLAVDEVEVSFERTLRNINNINHRYNMVSALKRKAAKMQESFEAEIQAAITEPTRPKKKLKKRTLPLACNKRVKGTEAKTQATVVEPKVSNLPKKNLKKKTSPLMGNKLTNKGNKAKITKGITESPLPVLPPIPYKECAPQITCLHATNCTNAATQVAARKPYGDRIRRLYRAARRKSQQEAMDQQDVEQCPDCSICRCSCSPCCLVYR